MILKRHHGSIKLVGTIRTEYIATFFLLKFFVATVAMACIWVQRTTIFGSLVFLF